MWYNSFITTCGLTHCSAKNGVQMKRKIIQIFMAIIVCAIGLFAWFKIIRPEATIFFVENQSEVDFPETFTNAEASGFNGGAVIYLQLRPEDVNAFQHAHGFNRSTETAYSKVSGKVAWRNVGPEPIPPKGQMMYLEGKTKSAGKYWGMMLHEQTGGVWALLYRPDMAGD